MEILVAKAQALPPEGQREVLDFVEFHTKACPARWLTWASICQPRTSIKPGARPGPNFRTGISNGRLGCRYPRAGLVSAGFSAPLGHAYSQSPGFSSVSILATITAPVSTSVRSPEFAADSIRSLDVSLCPLTVLAKGTIP
jgi:hypothetical protein